MFIRKKKYEAIIEEYKRLKIDYERLEKLYFSEREPQRETNSLCVGCKYHIPSNFPLSFGGCALNRTCKDYEEDNTNER